MVVKGDTREKSCGREIHSTIAGHCFRSNADGGGDFSRPLQFVSTCPSSA
jgi:hypothetical protein